jgi:hypothetical protein
MTTAAPSAALATIQPVFTDAERVALAGFLAGYHGLTWEAYTLDLRQGTWGYGPGPRHGHPAAVHHRRVLPVCGRRGTPGPLPGCACPAAAGRL